MKRLNALFLLLCFAPGQQSFAEQTSYSFGIVPQQAATTLVASWGPVLKRLEKLSGLSLTLKTDTSISLFEQQLEKGEYDFAYINPYHYTIYSKTPGYRAFAKAKDKEIKGILVTRKDSKIQSLEDLSNTKLAFPSPLAFAASMLTRANLALAQIPFEPVYVNSHDSVYAAVARGLYPAGGGVIRTFRNTDPRYREQLKILWTSEGYTPHAFVAHQRVRTEAVLALQQAMRQLSVNEIDTALLSALGLNGIVEAKDQDWNDVRALTKRLKE